MWFLGFQSVKGTLGWGVDPSLSETISTSLAFYLQPSQRHPQAPPEHTKFSNQETPRTHFPTEPRPSS